MELTQHHLSLFVFSNKQQQQQWGGGGRVGGVLELTLNLRPEESFVGRTCELGSQIISCLTKESFVYLSPVV